MNILKLDYQGLPVHANREAWFNATQIAAMFGRRPIDWLRLPETERYIRALCKREAEKQGKSEVRKSHFVKTKKGGDLSQPEIQGTWLHPKLAVAFARWCDIDFALWCDEQIEALITDGQVWHAERAKSSIAHQVMTEILRSKRQAEGKATLPHHYNNGDLSATDKGTAEAGAFKSTATLAKAKRELLKSGLIAVSRQGGKNQCTLYALTFLAIDDCGGKLDMGETRRAPDDWKRRHYELNPIPSLKQH